MKLKTLDLFAGIGGFSLGLERTGGFETTAFCEIDPVARQVLKKHWPNVPIFEDVKLLRAEDLNGSIDVITGGFPCQDISIAGKGAGLSGARSGLWFEYHRLIKEIRPRWVIAENVSALRSRGLDQVLRSLSEIGYDAEWHCIPAAAVGAPHRRDRIWIVAYPNGSLETDGGECAVSTQKGNGRDFGSAGSGPDDRQGRIRGSGQSSKDDVAHSSSLGSFSQSERDFGSVGKEGCQKEGAGNKSTLCTSSCSSEMADPSIEGLEGQRIRTGSTEPKQPVPPSGSCIVRAITRSSQWDFEPSVGRVAHGVSGRTHRLKQLGNAVVPQIPELIGRAILESCK